MSQIRKINKLKIADSFMQLKFHKGFKYIDSAGAILNLYESEDGKISYSMSPEQLIIFKPMRNVEALKISNHDFWMHFSSPKNLEEVNKIFQEQVNRVLAITQVSQIMNLGWRNQFMFEKKIVLNLNSALNLEYGDLINLSVQNKINEVKTNINIQLLEEKTTQKRKALLFDIDTYKENEFELADLQSNLNDLKDVIYSKELLAFTNRVLEKI